MSRRDRIQIIKDLIVSCNPSNKIICDLGSGKKGTTQNIKYKKRITIDIDKTNNPHIIHDLTKGIPLSDKSVDIIVAGEILEHIYNSKKFINEIKRILKNDGYIILSCPNICSLKYRIAFLLGKIPAHAAKADLTYKDNRLGHVRDYNFYEVKKILKGFRIVTEKSDSMLPKNLGNSVIIMAQLKSQPKK